MSAIRRDAPRAPASDAEHMRARPRRAERRLKQIVRARFRGKLPERLAERAGVLSIGSTREATKVLLQQPGCIRAGTAVRLETPRREERVLRPPVRPLREGRVRSKGARRIGALDLLGGL